MDLRTEKALAALAVHAICWRVRSIARRDRRAEQAQNAE